MEDRRGDWEHDVDADRVLLTQAQRATDKELDELDLLTQKHERVLLGDAESHSIGISAQVDQQEILLNELRAELRTIRATLHGDHAGNPGHEQRIERLEEKKTWREKREGWAWDSFTKITVELLLVLAMLLLNWERIEELIKSKMHPAPPAAEHVKKSRRHKKLKPIVKPDMEVKDDSSAADLP